MRYRIMTPSVMAEHCYAECHFCCLSLMLSVRFKPLLLSIFMPSVVAPFIVLATVYVATC
jgi:hypothetical protein